MPEPPIAVLDVKLQEVDAIRFFKWYDRYAEKVHSVLLNSDTLSNWLLKRRYSDADLVMGALKPMGQIIADNLSRFEERLQREWGYRGLWLNWRAVKTLEQATQ